MLHGMLIEMPLDVPLGMPHEVPLGMPHEVPLGLCLLRRVMHFQRLTLFTCMGMAIAEAMPVCKILEWATQM
jgi:hypothetical protein